ncbi:chloride channel protein [Myroides sp. WP-1]|uniref:chloride channel protein n=1 Tax=Myroides sp. WP-1 TaxID=2759944 RepID=UPI0015FDD280|nr:chloride channel protein [Myroides sp. WP-1]MBB1139275.1 chloride channel protein [Myroides sp. WP-1]
MNTCKKTKNYLFHSPSKPLLWLVLSLLLGVLIGTSAAIFLSVLEYVTQVRIHQPMLLWGLPLGGLFVGGLYHYFGGAANKGNNLLIQEYHHPVERIPLKMAPFVLLGTWITHLFGGSAGREGTAVQMGGAIADQFSRLFNLDSADRQALLLMGIAGGFAAVFGTPLAGMLFALELMVVGRSKYNYILPLLLTAIVSHFVCISWGITHTNYTVESVPALTTLTLVKVSIAGLLFGWTAILFVKATDTLSHLATTKIAFPPLRPFIGGLILIGLFYSIQDTRFLGLGIETLVDSFTNPQDYSVFLLKILFTAITLGTGFKGGEVTPLFFIGATLGSFLAVYLQLPIGFVASLGFVAVFAGATKTPLACIFMAGELFGSELLIYAGLACLVAYLSSGKHSIYKFQLYL